VDALTGERVETSDGALDVGRVFANLPVALLVRAPD
jgi:hypothetical protein